MASRELTPDDLNRPDWNSLLKNYDKHDIGEAYFQSRVEQIGLHVEHWGIDRRNHEDGLIFDNKMDLRLWEPLDGQTETPTFWPQSNSSTTLVEDGLGEWELVGVVDVKTKSNDEWMGKFNLRHLVHYAEWSRQYDVPVFIFMTMVDTDAQAVGEQSFLAPIPGDWDWHILKDHFDGKVDLSYGGMKDNARTCSIVKRTFRAQDGNLVVNIKDEYKYNFDWFVEEVLS